MQFMVAQSKNEEFSNRLNHLLDTMSAPPISSGRARWFHNYIKKELKIDVSYEAARKWLTGESIPYTKRISAIAKGFGGTTEYLLGETAIDDFPREHHIRECDNTTYNTRQEDESFLKMLEQMDGITKESLRVIMQALLSGQDDRAEIDSESVHKMPAEHEATRRPVREEK